MLNYVNTVLVSNLSSAAVLSAEPAAAAKMSTPSADAGKFIIMNCDANVAEDSLYDTSKMDGSTQTIKVGIVTKKNCAVRMPDGTTEYRPIVKWSNEIKGGDIKSYSKLTASEWASKPKEDTVSIDFSGVDASVMSEWAEGGKRIVVRLTYKDMPHRYRKWTESYEYVTVNGDDDTSIATAIANMINREWKRARVQASVSSSTLVIEALPYDDDDAIDTLNWANKVRFNANVYWVDPAADGWESTNKHYPLGLTITKTPGEEYPATAKRVRDRESWAMGYQGILNRGEGTWPIIRPDMETQLGDDYDAITLEFENMYRAADDIQRKTKQTLEVYGHNLAAITSVLDTFVFGYQQNENFVPSTEQDSTNP